MNGIIIIDKPEKFTSHDVVARLRRILNTKKIGHTGTLDPFATGVLVMLVGKATRLAQFLDKDEKTYEAIIRFGFETDTGDRTGNPKVEVIKTDVKREEIEAVLPEFSGDIEQVPPMYSAKKVKGKKLYELARKGIEIERKPVAVRISELQILDDTKLIEEQEISIKVACSAGTYIRSLAEDIGRRIDAPCHLAELRRIKAGNFEISRAVSIEELEEIVQAEELSEILVSMNEAVLHMPLKTLSEIEVKRISNGMKVDASFDGVSVQNIRLIDADQNLVAIGKYLEKEQQIQPRIVFINS